MKFNAALLALIAVASAQDYEQCREGVMGLGQYLQTDEEIAAVEEGMVDLVCTTLPEENIEGCATAVYTRWHQISEALFIYENISAAICLGAGYSTKRIPFGQQDVTCAECETFLGEFATLFESDYAADVAGDFEEAVFCENPIYIEAANIDTCKQFVSLVGKQAFAALGSILRVSASRICTDDGCAF